MSESPPTPPRRSKRGTPLPPEGSEEPAPVAKKKPRGRAFRKKAEGDDPRRNRQGRPPGPPPPPGFRQAVVHLGDEAMRTIHAHLSGKNEMVAQRAAEWVGNALMKMMFAKMHVDGSGLPVAVDLTVATDEELTSLTELREKLDGLLARISARQVPEPKGAGPGAPSQGGAAPPAH